ncbi:MAG: 1-phosphofructokinase family hexose kinase [Oscillospiraceae bacterium]|nr:1-phosphofructokinase family hexose kinase [Oscillospiraceae bacterium]
MIITVTLNPALDKTISVSRLMINGVNRVEDTRLDAGGKGINVSKSVKALGGETLAMGILGGESGLYIQHSMDKLGIPSKFCFVDAPTRTNIKIVDNSMHTSTNINERGEPVDEATLQQVFENLKQEAKPGDTVIVASTNPPGTREELLGEWTRELKAMGVKVCLDCTGVSMRRALTAGPDLIKPNKGELEEICGRRLYFDVDVIAAAKVLIENGVQRVAVSLGAEGALFITEDQVLRVYGLKVPVVSTVGSGDGMMGALAYYLQEGMEWKEAAMRSVAVSAAQVMRPGSEPALLSDAEALLEQVIVDELM